MKITSLKAVYPRYRHVPPSWRTHLWQIVVRVETDAGVVGFGYGGGGVAAVEIVNRHMAELTVGMRVDSPSDIAAIWDRLYEASTPYGRKGVAIMALSGVDLALWDALGRAESRPVSDLIGGPRRDSVPVYATGPDSDWYAELGITGQKISHRWTGEESDYDSAEQRVAEVRQVLGPDANVMIDSYMTWTFDVSVEMARRLRDLKVHWFEDVLTPDDLAGHAALKGKVRPTLIAGGEHEFTHHGFREIAQAGALDIWQPDITWCGGITAGLRILDLANAAGVPVVPHRGGEPWGLHFIAGSGCHQLAEMVMGSRNDPRDMVWLDAPQPVDGCVQLTDAPGFGVRLNEALL